MPEATAAAAIASLPRLGSEALGPCVFCERVILATGVPVFYRFKIQQCGVDAREVQRHVGLAASIAPGSDGLALAGILGPKVEPVVVFEDPPETNICGQCALQRGDILMILAAVLERSKDGDSTD